MSGYALITGGNIKPMYTILESKISLLGCSYSSPSTFYKGKIFVANIGIGTVTTPKMPDWIQIGSVIASLTSGSLLYNAFIKPDIAIILVADHTREIKFIVTNNGLAPADNFIHAV